ncbi:MAG: hypothetical protein JWO93_1242 [Micrococcaceae bacterium]|nr:hypothetical protein [Micrococcaceae bacterium]
MTRSFNLLSRSQLRTPTARSDLHHLFLTTVASATALALTALGAALLNAPPVRADTNPIPPDDSVTVTADALPTAQLNGVAWQQVVVGNTVYVAGKFTTARPAGAAAGTSTVTRNNILAYDLSTGVLTSFAPNLNGQALTIAASPDGSRIYVGGDFTTVNGVSRLRAAAFSTATGELLTTFNPRMGGSVRAITATGDTVYLGGTFTAIGSTARSRLAAVRSADGGLLPWNPNANERVNALVVAPDAQSVVIGGAFSTLNGSNKPGYGLGRVNALTGANQAFAANDVVRNAGTDSAILSLSSDGTNVYGTGYIYGTGGNLEGSFSANWSNGAIRWVEDCHGDTYGIWASETAVYTAGHAHYCGNLGGYPEVTPRVWHRAVAFSKQATGTLTKDPYGYPSFTGVASPRLLNWFPDLDTGTATGQNQGPWAVAGNSNYVAMAGEFQNVNGKPQQGLVRFAVSTLAPNAEGPRLAGAATNPTLSYTGPGAVRVRWQTNWDRDNRNLTYRVMRDGNTASEVYTVDGVSTFWSRPTLEFNDSGLSAGDHTYRIFTTDWKGNEVRSDAVTVNVATGAGTTNAAPTASFTATPDGLTVAVDGSDSNDPDGTITGYAWNYGDGATGSGVNATHTYATGTYTITLTVTDNGGQQGSTTREVTVASPDDPPPAGGALAVDAFGRTVSGGFGTADTGGPWTLNGSAALFSVAGGAGNIRVSAGAGPSAYLGSVSSTGTDSQVRISFDRLATSSGSYAWLSGRRVDGANDYRAKVNVSPSGAVRLDVTKLAGGTETTLTYLVVPGLQYTANSQLSVRLQVTGTSPSTLRAKVWKVGSTEPSDWQLTATDTTAALQRAGGVGLLTYVSGGATNGPVTVGFDELSVESVP